jgi:hypothetical protein
MTGFNTSWNAAVQRLVEAKKQALLRETEQALLREMEIEADRERRRAEYEPLIRKVGNETARWTVAEVAKWLLTEDEVGERLADALRERHAVADPLASEIAATVRSVLSALVADINIVAGPGEDSDAGPLVP